MPRLGGADNSTTTFGSVGFGEMHERLLKTIMWLFQIDVKLFLQNVLIFFYASGVLDSVASYSSATVTAESVGRRGY